MQLSNQRMREWFGKRRNRHKTGVASAAQIGALGDKRVRGVE